MSAEIKYIIDAIANEKGLPKETVIAMIERALAVATAKKFKEDVDIRVEIDPDTGSYEAFRVWTVVDSDDPDLELSSEKFFTLEQAKEKHPNLEDLEIGTTIEEALESTKLGRIGAQLAKQIIVQEMQKEERNKILAQYESKIGELLPPGTVKKITENGVVVDFGDRAAGIIPKDQLIPRENFRLNDPVRAYLADLRKEGKGPQLLLSRTNPSLLIKLFEIEVPEISEEVIEIKSAARDPGSRAKIAVKTNDGRIDPIGSCVGMRGARVQAISNELNGEKVDIILWDPNPAQFVINAMAPAEVISITVDEEKEEMDVIVNEEQLSQAIGRNGQNVRLASELTGWKLNILAETEAQEQDEKEAEKIMALFIETLGIDEELSALLIQEGFSTIKDIAYAPKAEMLGIEGMDEEITQELKDRAKEALLTAELLNETDNDAMSELLTLESMTDKIAKLLLEKEISTREQLADLSVIELCEEIESIDEKLAAKLIMEARAPWFNNEE